jgi:hypothetical protein
MALRENKKMQDRSSLTRLVVQALGSPLTVFAPLALALALFIAGSSRDAQAGILRDVMVSVGLSKAPPAAPGTPGAALPRKGFACCNLHYSKDWINDGNYAELPMIPAGTPIEVVSYGRQRAYVNIDGKQMRLGHDYGRDQESLEVWVDKIVVAEDPRPRIAGYPRGVQEAIRNGKVMVGMTREQALASVGYPLTSENASLDAAVWRIWRSTHGEYDLNFRPDGRVGSVTGDDAVLSMVVLTLPPDPDPVVEAPAPTRRSVKHTPK